MESTNWIEKNFPEGLHVMIVDDDFICLILLENSLSKFGYKVTKCNRAEVALEMLRVNKDGYDIVMIDVHMPDMDGFQLLEQIGLEMDIPVIMISGDNGENLISKGVDHGACDFLTKPVPMDSLKNIWQHAYRKKKNDKHSKDESCRSLKGKGEAKEDTNDDLIKKERIIWNLGLHTKFLDAVGKLGGSREATPMEIQKLMNTSGLKRESVASHLQRYRIALSMKDEQIQKKSSNPGKKFRWGANNLQNLGLRGYNPKQNQSFFKVSNFNTGAATKPRTPVFDADQNKAFGCPKVTSNTINLQDLGLRVDIPNQNQSFFQVSDFNTGAATKPQTPMSVADQNKVFGCPKITSNTINLQDLGLRGDIPNQNQNFFQGSNFNTGAVTKPRTPESVADQNEVFGLPKVTSNTINLQDLGLRGDIPNQNQNFFQGSNFNTGAVTKPRTPESVADQNKVFGLPKVTSNTINLQDLGLRGDIPNQNQNFFQGSNFNTGAVTKPRTPESVADQNKVFGLPKVTSNTINLQDLGLRGDIPNQNQSFFQGTNFNTGAVTKPRTPESVADQSKVFGLPKVTSNTITLQDLGLRGDIPIQNQSFFQGINFNTGVVTKPRTPESVTDLDKVFGCPELLTGKRNEIINPCTWIPLENPPTGISSTDPNQDSQKGFVSNLISLDTNHASIQSHALSFFEQQNSFTDSNTGDFRYA